MKAATPYGPNPWQQRHWDWRAAGNFIGGGLGSGLIVIAVLAGASGPDLVAALLLGAAAMAAGLLCVWAEIGRPLRALNVFINPRSSWMTREGMVATLALPAAAAAALAWPALAWPAAALVLAFVYCQGRILVAARGIPAWREPALTPLIVATALAEGAGVLLLLQALQGRLVAATALLAGAAWLVRAVLWLLYRRRLGTALAPAAGRVLDGVGRWLLWAGAVLPLTALALALTGLAGAAPSLALAALAGVAAAATGAGFKHRLITRAAFNQGFALQHLPVRGARR